MSFGTQRINEQRSFAAEKSFMLDQNVKNNSDVSVKQSLTLHISVETQSRWFSLEIQKKNN